MAIGTLHEIIIDCANPEALARFWQAMIGGEVVVEADDWVVLDGDEDGFFFGFQRVSEPKTGKWRSSCTPGVSMGTRIIDCRRCGLG